MDEGQSLLFSSLVLLFLLMPKEKYYRFNPFTAAVKFANLPEATASSQVTVKRVKTVAAASPPSMPPAVVGRE